MPGSHVALDDLQLRRWLAAKEPIVRANGDGLTFTLSEFGTATWVLRYSRGTRRRELTSGEARKRTGRACPDRLQRQRCYGREPAL